MKIIFAIFAFFLITYQTHAQNNKLDSLKIGDPIPIFYNLNNASVGGKQMVSLNDYKNKKGVIIVFMTNNCYHCIMYRQRIKNLHTKFAKKGYPVIAINPFNSEYAIEDSFDEMVKLAKKDAYIFPYLQTNNEALPAQYNLKYTPTVFVAQKVGTKLLLKYKGAIDNDTENNKPQKINYVENVVNALLLPKKNL